MKRDFLWILFLVLVFASAPGVMRLGALWKPPADSPQIVSFTATPRVIRAGESATLSWEVQGVDSVTIAWRPDDYSREPMEQRRGLPPSGMMIVQPRTSTFYILKCDSRSGDVCMAASTSVRVK
ncbi:MAG TPA: hypothetical protein VHC72_08595 [Bryobacteraceae bacterium]|nr:hypothetical protein [Bryobacteraceae bacterium]